MSNVIIPEEISSKKNPPLRASNFVLTLKFSYLFTFPTSRLFDGKIPSLSSVTNKVHGSWKAL